MLLRFSLNFFLPSSILSSSSGFIIPCSFAQLKHVSWLSGLLQNDSHCLPLHPPGPFPPVLLIISTSSFVAKPCFSANTIHVSMLFSLSQYASQLSFESHPPGVSPRFNCSANFRACRASSPFINPAFSPKATHSSMGLGFLQYASH